jgi:hypothetical protein
MRRGPTVGGVADDFAERYAGLLTGSRRTAVMTFWRPETASRCGAPERLAGTPGTETPAEGIPPDVVDGWAEAGVRLAQRLALADVVPGTKQALCERGALKSDSTP